MKIISIQNNLGIPKYKQIILSVEKAISEEQLKIKLTSLQMNIVSCFNPYFDKLSEKQKTELQYLYHNYALAIMDIKEDEVNDKTRRLFIKTEDFTHTFLKEGLKYFKEVIDEEVFE